MLWRTMLRETADALIANALADAGASVFSRRDIPIPSGGMPAIAVYADDKKAGVSATQYLNRGLVTIEVRAEAATRIVNDVDLGAQDAVTLLETLCETIETALLAGVGMSVVCACVQGSAIVTPSDPSLAAKLRAGMRVMGPVFDDGSGDIVALAGVNDDGTLTLTQAFPSASGDYTLRIGSFVALFEPPIDSFETIPTQFGKDNARHVACATIEIAGHVSEFFAAPLTQDLKGLSIYVDCVNAFDPNGDYSGQTPFNLADAPPRTSGPDGRPEIAADIDTSS